MIPFIHDIISVMEKSIDSHPKISVITPICNGAKHLGRCIDSVLANGFEDIEIILLNDGSTDESPEIMAGYKEAYPDIIRTYSQENIGVAGTRNRGIELARGKYILFLDQDDWFDNDYILRFYNAIENSGSDVVVGGYKRPDAAGRIVLKRLLPGTGYYRFIAVAAWAKIHRASFLKENGIEFFNNNIGEDVAFSMKEAILSDKYSFIPYIGYNWYLNEESVSETEHKGFRESIALFNFLEKLAGYEYEDERIKEYFIVKSALYYLMHSGRSSAPEKYREVYAEIMGWVNQRFPGFSNNRFLNFGLPGEPFKVRLAIFLLLMIHRTGIIKLFSKLYCKSQ